MIVEGQKVCYAGDADPFNEVGAPGRVLAVSGDAAHVQWTGGPKAGSIDLVEANDLVADRNHTASLLADPQPYLGDRVAHASHEQAEQFYATSARGVADHTSRMQVRAAYDDHGEDGVLSVLDETGVLATLASHAEYMHQHLIGAVHADDHMRTAMVGLEVDERDVVVAKVVTALLTDLLKES